VAHEEPREAEALAVIEWSARHLADHDDPVVRRRANAIIAAAAVLAAAGAVSAADGSAPQRVGDRGQQVGSGEGFGQ
jgi:hypothetical protein